MTKEEFVEMIFVQGGLFKLREECSVSNPDSFKKKFIKEKIKQLKAELIEISNNSDDNDWRESIIQEELNYPRVSFNFDIPVYSFYIAKYLTTQEQWMETMGDNPSKFKGKKKPVESIKWYDACEYCNRLSEKFGLQKVYEISEDDVSFEIKVIQIDAANGYRLPNHIQWIYAATGGRKKEEQLKYFEETKWKKIGWFYDSCVREMSLNAFFRKEGTRSVGKKAPNLLGIYDIFGNVDELCGDCKWTYEYADQILDCVERKVKISEMKGPDYGEKVYALGGSWRTYCPELSYDNLNISDSKSNINSYLVNKTSFREDLGFRVALPVIS